MSEDKVVNQEDLGDKCSICGCYTDSIMFSRNQGFVCESCLDEDEEKYFDYE
jgi:hypothetical protein